MQAALIGDDDVLLDMLQAALQHAGYTVVVIHDVEGAAARLRAIKLDALLLNVGMYPRESGWHLFAELAADPTLSTLPLIVYTIDHQDLETHAAVLQQQGCQVLLAPFTLAGLYEALKRAGRDEREATA
ncbi:MAG TPA: response regulator [Chloroflexota bacterium]|nr:response regulator [Chloroflexota bacterium]